MSLITLENITKYYGSELILDDISMRIAKDDRTGVIGSNGTGKTTLLEIMTGDQTDYTGNVIRAKWLKIGYLSQEPELDHECSLRDEMLQVFQYQIDLEKQMEEAANQIAEEDDYEELLEKYARLQEKHEKADGYSYQHRIDKVLGGLGFSHADYELPIKVLSGGQKSRAVLARLLLKKPDLLLLDEPTNHLDIGGIEWLEDYLSSEYKGAVLMVSHDRYFLDRVATKIIELEDHRIKEYRGNYSKYIETKKIEQLTQMRQYEKQQEFIEHEKEFIRKYHAGQRSKEARGRQKKLDRMEKIEKPKTKKKKMQFEFTSDIRGGNDILRARELGKIYDDKVIFEDLDFDVFRGDVVGIIGPNGAGKTTFFKIILGQEEPTVGELWTGHNLHFGYYDQEHKRLNFDNTVIEEFWELRPKSSQEEIRDFLARFLFTEDEVFKQISKLSGGEQSRVMLAKLLLENANVLLMDEPTNHLDILSREALEDALQEYPATIFVITHDRYLLDKLATKILVFEDGTANLWDGTYSEYQLYKKEKKQHLEEEEKDRKQKQAQQKKQSQKKKKRRPGRAYYV